MDDLVSSGYRSSPLLGITEFWSVVLASDGIFRRADLDLTNMDERNSRNSNAGDFSPNKRAEMTGIAPETGARGTISPQDGCRHHIDCPDLVKRNRKDAGCSTGFIGGRQCGALFKSVDHEHGQQAAGKRNDELRQ